MTDSRNLLKPLPSHGISYQDARRTGLRIVICLMALLAYYACWRVNSLSPDWGLAGGLKLPLETRRASGGEDYLTIGRLIHGFIGQRAPSAQAQGYPRSMDEHIRNEMRVLMKEFGAEDFSIPFEFLAEVKRFIWQFQDRDRNLMARALVDGRKNLEQMRQILGRDNLPRDLAFMALVESGFLKHAASAEGAAGFWQFTEETARSYGMEVNETLDERLDLSKSTEAASRYIRELILDFGTGSSVMLAIAAYNSGPEKVRRAVRNVKDPIKQRNFWYLYQTRALPEETREYVPKVFAAILIGRNPQKFGF